MKIGYCTNVHAGHRLNQVNHNLHRFGSAVRRHLDFDDNQSLPVGLWLSDQASRELTTDRLDRWRDWLAVHRFMPYTFNGFPFSDFHQEVVKRDVYRPTWADNRRLEYTLRLAQILAGLLPEGESGTISTLPVAWPNQPKHRLVKDLSAPFASVDTDLLTAAASNLRRLAIDLDRIAQSTGRIVTVGIEPEPGCLLDTANDVVRFFQQYLLTESATAATVQKYIGVCHDVCHSAVMFERQATAISAYHEAGIQITKLQISSALEARFETSTTDTSAADSAGLGECFPATEGSPNEQTLAALRQFAEPRYLHQTVTQNDQGMEFFDDLPIAIQHQGVGGCPTDRRWRVHFHVPIFLEKLGPLWTTSSAISDCLGAIDTCYGSEHRPDIEIETYAWNVLPAAHQWPDLAAGIAAEIRWFVQRAGGGQASLP